MLADQKQDTTASNQSTDPFNILTKGSAQLQLKRQIAFLLQDNIHVLSEIEEAVKEAKYSIRKNKKKIGILLKLKQRK